jgi:hypothetical protein
LRIDDGHVVDANFARADRMAETRRAQTSQVLDVSCRGIRRWNELLFADDGVFIDESVKITYTGPNDWDYPVRNYGTAFADMHRELYDLLTVG